MSSTYASISHSGTECSESESLSQTCTRSRTPCGSGLQDKYQCHKHKKNLCLHRFEYSSSRKSMSAALLLQHFRFA